MFTIEQDSGTYTGSLRRHNGYYAGDFTRSPMCTASELSAPKDHCLAGRTDRLTRV